MIAINDHLVGERERGAPNEFLSYYWDPMRTNAEESR